MLRLLMARHGQTEWNLHGRNQGHSDTTLDETGRTQAKQLADALSPESLKIVYCSDLSRCVETANFISDKSGVEVLSDSRLRERNYGLWEGKSSEEIERDDGEAFALYRTDPVLHGPTGGETGIEVFARVGYFLTELLRDHKEGAVAIIAHGGSVAALLAALVHGSASTATCLRIMNCSLSELHILPGGVRRLIRINDIAHLDPAPLRSVHADQPAK